nr:unnamed protein product [Spirometra erinaceieuropaei]
MTAFQVLLRATTGRLLRLVEAAAIRMEKPELCKQLDHSTTSTPAELTSSTSGSSSSAGGPESADSMAVTNAKLIKAVLDAKICLLLNSPHVMTFLQGRQRLLEEYKRATDLFSVANTTGSTNHLCASDLTLSAKAP